MKKNKYQRIMARPDKKRPLFLDELLGDAPDTLVGFYKKNPKAMVMKLKIVCEDGLEVEYSWSEKGANQVPK